MNKDLEQFSEERLINMERSLSIGSLDDRPTMDEMLKIIRIALAAKQAKPVAWILNNGPSGASHIERDGRIADLFGIFNGNTVEPLYTTPQPANTEQDDRRRMDWLVSQNVEVRTPMPYGSHARFVAQCDSDDCEEYHTTLREQIDAAMLDAAPKPGSEL